MYINNKTSHLHLHNYITMFIVSVDYPRRSTIPPPILHPPISPSPHLPVGPSTLEQSLFPPSIQLSFDLVSKFSLTWVRP